MDVSVIIPCWNYGRFLEEAVDSVLQQSVNNLEVLIIDDGSDDDTPSIIEAITPKDPRIRSFRTAHLGPAHARNLGTAEARGRYIAFLDCDDRWLPQKLERQLGVMESEPDVVMHFTNLIWFTDDTHFRGNLFNYLVGLDRIPSRPSRDGSGTVITSDPFVSLLRLPMLAPVPSATMVRAEVVRSLEWRDGLHPAEDYEYFTRVSALGDVAYVNDILVQARRHGNNSFNDRVTPPKSWIRAFNHMLDVDRHTLPEHHRREVQAKVGRVWSGLGWQYYWRRRPFAAASAYLSALKYPEVRGKALAHLITLPIVPFLPPKDQNDEELP